MRTRIHIVLLLVFLMSCEDETPQAVEEKSYSLSIVSGDAQSAVEGKLFKKPLVVKVVDDAGNPAQGVPIQWEFENIFSPTNTGAQFFENQPVIELYTNKDGMATAYWKASTLPGDYEGSVMLLQSDLKETIPSSNVSFTYTIIDNDISYNAHIVSGNEQVGKVERTLEQPLVLRVTDDEGHGISGVMIDWSYEVTDTQIWGNLNYNTDYNVTNPEGYLSVFWVPGDTPGTQTLTAHVLRADGTPVEGSPLVFTANVLDLEIILTANNSNNQSAPVGAGISTPVEVLLMDETGFPAENYDIDFRFSSTLGSFLDLEGDPIVESAPGVLSVLSNEEGKYITRPILPNVPGDYQLEVTVKDRVGLEVNGSPIIFNFTATPLGSFQDPRDGQIYPTVTLGAQEWFYENLNYETPQSICYFQFPQSCDEFGKLYLFDEAINACPAGWRLPTDDDWKQLEIYLGIDESQLDNYSYRVGDDGFFLRDKELGLLEGGWTGFDLKQSGYFFISEGEYFYRNNRNQADTSSVDSREVIWSSTLDEEGRPIVRSAGTGLYNGLSRLTASPTTNGLSVRCIKD